MHRFVAKSDKQLGLCLKLLFTEQIKGRVELELTEKNRVIYLIYVDIDNAAWDKLNSNYNVLIG